LKKFYPHIVRGNSLQRRLLLYVCG